ncbi:MAG: PorT family protein [Chitinophagaceae bacterium]|nr:MAG: PorT family protein [Chitinophagaceae bacterium]
MTIDPDSLIVGSCSWFIKSQFHTFILFRRTLSKYFPSSLLKLQTPVMKKFSVLVTVLFLTLAASAQFSLGAKAGVNASNFRGSDAEGAKGRLGFYVGATGELTFGGNLAFAPEIVYSFQGVKQTEEDADAKLNMSYINIPLLARYKFENGFYVETGLQPGFLMSAKVKIDSESASVKDAFNTVDLSVPFGLGFRGESGFGVNLRYNLGLSKLDKDGDGKVYNGVAQLGITYRLFR